jgi:hypothetical protein
MNGPKATSALSPFDSQLRTLVGAAHRSHSCQEPTYAPQQTPCAGATDPAAHAIGSRAKIRRPRRSGERPRRIGARRSGVAVAASSTATASTSPYCATEQWSTGYPRLAFRCVPTSTGTLRMQSICVMSSRHSARRRRPIFKRSAGSWVCRESPKGFDGFNLPLLSIQRL